MSAPTPDKNSTHLAGEYFVAAELYRRGYSVAMTLGNAKAIDLFAEHDAQTVNVQVKAIRDKKSIGWPMMKDKVVDGVVYVFVCLNAPGEAPDYYICDSFEARALVKQYRTRGIVDLSRIKKTGALGRWGRISQALTPVEVSRRERSALPDSRPVT
jgi:hypothetical protein